MAKFCGNCGEELNNGLCPRCMGIYPVLPESYLLLKCKDDITKRILTHIIVNCLVWLCIGIFQLFYYYNPIGLWNISVCLYGILASYNIKLNTESFMRKWDRSMVTILVFCIINLLLKSMLGFVLNLHMLYVRYIINKNKMLLCIK